MSELIAWALQRARAQTLTLVEDLHPAQMCIQSASGQNHPAWILGHLLLGDIYLLSLLKIQDLSEDFADLLARYGPGSTPASSSDYYPAKPILVARLTQTGSVRVEAIRRMQSWEFAQPTPDELLAQVQPTIAHHLLALIFHEGHHDGQLSAWRRAQGLAPMRGSFAPTGI